MRIKSRLFLVTICMILIVLSVVWCAGCTSAAPSASGGSSATSFPVSALETESAARVPAASAPAGTDEQTTTAYLSDGITITYPSDWEKEEASETSLRDYGRTTTNIAIFYSPTITAERARWAEPNPDESTYSTLSIDVDPDPVTDFQNYFNLASLALDNHYEDFHITKHNYQLQVSVTDDFSGYKTYQLNFDAKNTRRAYYFTDADGTIYIFAFTNPSPYSAEVDEMIDSVKISPRKTGTTKHR